MKSFIFIARAGQGAKSAANILARAAASQGLTIQEFPEYGPERMGAPVKSYVKIDKTGCVITRPEYSGRFFDIRFSLKPGRKTTG